MSKRFLVRVEGTHVEDDPRPFREAVRLFGKGLARSGFTVTEEVVDFDYEERPPTPAEPEDDGPDFSTLSKAELYEIAQELDLKGRSSMTKAELVEALEG